VAVHGAAPPQLLPAARHQLRPHAARDHHGHALLGRLHREVVRGGLAALPKGQIEAADAMGLDYWQAMRLIVLPQALRISIPGIVNTFIGLFKDTTLVSIISMFDPMRISSTIRATTDWGGIYWELYAFVALIFFVFCFAMSRYSVWLERQLERDHRR
jgi:general L-amino acid transport system permease protein